MYPQYYWYGFILFVILAISIDLFLMTKYKIAENFTNTIITSLIWVVFAVMMGIVIYLHAGHQQTIEFVTAYLVELSLSVDNVFVFIIIFQYLKIDIKYQHRLLFWGIFGAILFRLIMITCGVFLIKKFEWIFFPFGILLIYSAFKMLKASDSQSKNIKDNAALKFCKKHFNFTDELHEDKFIVYKKGKRFFTPAVIALILIEKGDLVFAIDSIPAVLAISKESFIIFSSNVFAILGLRSMYFLLARIVQKFSKLKYGITVILIYIGIKMILSTFHLYIPTYVSLSIIILSLSVPVTYSLLKEKD